MSGQGQNGVNLTVADKPSMFYVTERERKLVEFIRGLGFGSITVDVQAKEPVLIREAIKTVKL